MPLLLYCCDLSVRGIVFVGRVGGGGLPTICPRAYVTVEFFTNNGFSYMVLVGAVDVLPNGTDAITVFFVLRSTFSTRKPTTRCREVQENFSTVNIVDFLTR